MTGTTATTAAAIIRPQFHAGKGSGNNTAATTAIVAATETAPAPT